jgi:hypothetical protein
MRKAKAWKLLKLSIKGKASGLLNLDFLISAESEIHREHLWYA